VAEAEQRVDRVEGDVGAGCLDVRHRPRDVERQRTHFTALLRAAQTDGDLPPHRDPEREAIRLVALWDGLQYQWLYDRNAIDVASHLTAHLADLLPPRPGR
jgi:hypothetical protein